MCINGWRFCHRTTHTTCWLYIDLLYWLYLLSLSLSLSSSSGSVRPDWCMTKWITFTPVFLGWCKLSRVKTCHTCFSCSRGSHEPWTPWWMSSRRGSSNRVSHPATGIGIDSLHVMYMCMLQSGWQHTVQYGLENWCGHTASQEKALVSMAIGWSARGFWWLRSLSRYLLFSQSVCKPPVASGFS